MKLLVLGGTGFLGYHVLAEAVEAGHEVSAFTREGDAPLPEVEPLKGDRQGDLSALHGREWDAVFDTFSDPEARVGYRPAVIRFRRGPTVLSPVSATTTRTARTSSMRTSPLRRPGDASDDDPLQERSIAKLRCEEAVESGFEGADPDPAPRHHGRTAGPYRPLYVVAAAVYRRRQGSARPRRPGPSRAVHRRPRPLRLGGPDARRPQGRHVQRRRSRIRNLPPGSAGSVPARGENAVASAVSERRSER